MSERGRPRPDYLRVLRSRSEEDLHGLEDDAPLADIFELLDVFNNSNIGSSFLQTDDQFHEHAHDPDRQLTPHEKIRDDARDVFLWINRALGDLKQEEFKITREYLDELRLILQTLQNLESSDSDVSNEFPELKRLDPKLFDIGRQLLDKAIGYVVSKIGDANLQVVVDNSST